MAFIDELTVYIKAGDGGNGVVRWRREKFRPLGGPSGGDGGRGGSVYARGVRNVHLLSQYRAKKMFIAESGGNGGKNSLHGRHGEDLEIPFPVGSIITNTKTGEKVQLSSTEDRFLILKGGNGGRGNESFKSPTNQTPKQSTKGKKGEEGEFFIEVELIADIGLIGLPSAGKTSLLNELTRARGKVGDYPFTTLEPNLGECNGYIISDVPGLIEGASGGKGLGHKFLRHIRRTKVLIHLVSLENEDPVESYKVIRKELGDFDDALLKKREIIVLTKKDLVSEEGKISKIKERMQKLNPDVLVTSLLDEDSIKDLQRYIFKDL